MRSNAIEDVNDQAKLIVQYIGAKSRILTENEVNQLELRNVPICTCLTRHGGSKKMEKNQEEIQ
jgi:hypothetical protein